MEPSIDDYIAGTPTPGSSAANTGPLGIPAGSAGDFPGRVVMPGTGVADNGMGGYNPVTSTVDINENTYYPLYEPDDVARFGQLSPETVSWIQSQLVAAGLIGPSTTISWGAVDGTTENAIEELLGMSNRQGLDWRAMLGQLASNPDNAGGRGGGGGGGRGGGAVRAPLVKQLPNREDTKESLRQWMIDQFGGDFTPSEELDPVVDDFISRIGAQQEQAYNMALTGGTLEEPPSLEQLATQQIEESGRSGEVSANRFAGYAAALEGIIGGG